MTEDRQEPPSADLTGGDAADASIPAPPTPSWLVPPSATSPDPTPTNAPAPTSDLGWPELPDRDRSVAATVTWGEVGSVGTNPTWGSPPASAPPPGALPPAGPWASPVPPAPLPPLPGEEAARTTVWIGLLGVLVLVVAVGVLIAIPLLDDDEPRAALVDDGAPPTTEHDMDAMGGIEGDEPPERIPGVTIYDVPSRFHADGSVDYAQTPPVGGDHNAIWQNCGFYDEAIGTEHAVHSLEHAVVWITYRPDLPADQLAGLRRLGDEEHVIVSPWTESELPAPIVLSAWGVQGLVDDVDDPLVDQFLETYRHALSAPEPNGPCEGGEGGPAPLR